MARAQTVFSELHLAVAITPSGKLNDIENVTAQEISTYEEELSKRQTSKAGSKKNVALSSAGILIKNYIIANGVTQPRVIWTGNEAQDTTAVAKDLEIHPLNLRVSIKENANVFINGSPVSIFIDVPNGLVDQKGRGADWFREVASKEIQNYYKVCNSTFDTGFETIDEFYKNLKKADRKPFQKHVTELHKQKNAEVLQAYKEMCDRVSEASADIFNENFQKFKCSRKNKNALNPIFKFFFKINSVQYILAGSEKTKPFAVFIPPSTEWTKRYEFLDIVARPLDAGQPEVMLNFTFKEKDTKETFSKDIKIEIRWSHGKFCGNPEAKVYKKWSYTDLPWANTLQK